MSNLLFSSTNVPAAFVGTRFEDYDVKRGRADLLDQIESWRPTAEKPNLVMLGMPGLGKTMLACALMNEYQRDLTFRGKSSGQPIRGGALTYLRQKRFPVYFVQVAEWIEMQLRLFRLEKQLDRGSEDLNDYLPLDQLLEDLKCRVELLVIDDVGKEHRTQSAFAVDQFDYLLRTRYNNGLRTAMTSNLPLSRWSMYSSSMENFIERTSQILIFR